MMTRDRLFKDRFTHRVPVLRAAGYRVLLLALCAFILNFLPPALTPQLLIVMPAHAGHRNDGGDDDSRRMQEDADKQARAQQQEADRQARAQQQEADRQARAQQQEADRQARAQQQEADKQARAQQQESDRSASARDGNINPQPQPSRNDETPQPAPQNTPAVSRDQDTPAASRDDNNSHAAQRDTSQSGAIHSDQAKPDGDKAADNSSSKQADKKDGDADTDRKSKAVSRDDAEDNKPPATVEKWLQQLTGANQKKPAAATNSASPQVNSHRGIAQSGKSAATGPVAAAAPVAPPVKGTQAKSGSPKLTGGGYPQPIALPELATPDVLAVNASRKTLERAQALGFTTKPATSFANLAFAVTSLQPPAGMSPQDARALLSRELPSVSFGANQKFRIYRTASGTDPFQAGTRAATMRPAGGPEDCGGDHCFGRSVIGWKPELHTCVSGVRIGIIDTSVDVSHPALAHKKLELKHFGSTGAADAPDWHGTGVTALLAGDTSSGTPGMIPDASFYIADIFHADADHEPASDTVSMLKAFDWLDAKGVKIINMSLSGPPDDLILRAIEKLSSKGVLIVAAAGNEGPSAGPSYPAAYDQVIAVTAVNKELQGYRYANRGNYIDVAAPGVAIWTALPGAREGFHSGTSFATPYVTASLAAIYATLAAKTHDEALLEIQTKDLGEPGRDPIFGKGLLVAPSSCNGPQIAAAPTQPALSTTVPLQGVGASSETLPWLGLSATSN